MKKFPLEMKHGSGVMMCLEPARLLLALKKEFTCQDVEARLANVGFVLEDAGEEREKKPRPVEEIINHTETRFWIRSRSDKPVDADMAQALENAFEGLLAWIGPVYHLENTPGRGGMICPLPNVLVIRPARLNEEAKRDFVKTLRGYGLEEVQEKSKYLGDYRYYVIPDLSQHDAYQLQEVLTKKESLLVSEAHFESMPMTLDYCILPNDPLFPQQWDMTQIQAGGPGITGWDISTGMNTVIVAVLDSGCDLTHPDITYSPLSINLGSMAPGSGGPVAGSGHGTSCAGIVAATFNNMLGVAGVAGGCVVMALARQNSSDVEVATGLNYAAANGARVVSMSFGRYAPGEGFGPTGWNFALIDPAIANAVNVSGLVLCAATGNEDTGTVNRYPARHALVMACGASDQADNRKTTTSPDGENWWGSNFGTNVHLGVTTGVSVVAPGVLIPTIDIQGAGGYNPSAGTAGDYVMNFNGTSSATPHVAGMAGLLLSYNPALTSPQVRAVIERTAEKVGTVPYTEVAGFPNGTRNQEMGYGRINVFRALQELSPRLVTAIADNGNFGDICLGSFADELLTINNSSAYARLEISNITSSSPDFLTPNVVSYPLVVGPGDSINVVIRFQPTSFGPKSATLSIISNDPLSPHTIEITGDAPTPRLVLITANTGNFGRVCVGSFMDGALILSNSGKCTLSVSSITSSSGEFIVPQVLLYPVTISAGNSLSVPIRFEPGGFGPKSATLTVISDDPASPHTIDVSGEAPSGKLAITGSLCFGGVKACCTAERTISICNTGDCKLYVTSVAFKRKSRHWKLINNPFPATLHPGACLGVIIRYKATEKCPRCCELIITSDDPVTPVQVLDVMAYTVWSDCTCKQCCEACRNGRCEKHHTDCCSAECYDDCCDNESHESEEEDED